MAGNKNIQSDNAAPVAAPASMCASALVELVSPTSLERFNVYWKDQNMQLHAGPRGILEGHIDDAFEHYLMTLVDAAPDAAAIDKIFEGQGMFASCPSLPGTQFVAAKMMTRFPQHECRPLLVCNVRRGTVTGSEVGLAVAFAVSRDGTNWTTYAELLSEDDQIVVADGSLSKALTAGTGDVLVSKEELADVFASVEAWLRHDRRYNDDQPCTSAYWRFVGNDGGTRFGFGNEIDKNTVDWLINRERALADCTWGERLTPDEVVHLGIIDRVDLLDLASIAEADRIKWSSCMLAGADTTGKVKHPPSSQDFSPFKRVVVRKNGIKDFLSV